MGAGEEREEGTRGFLKTRGVVWFVGGPAGPTENHGLEVLGGVERAGGRAPSSRRAARRPAGGEGKRRRQAGRRWTERRQRDREMRRWRSWARKRASARRRGEARLWWPSGRVAGCREGWRANARSGVRCVRRLTGGEWVPGERLSELGRRVDRAGCGSSRWWRSAGSWCLARRLEGERRLQPERAVAEMLGNGGRSRRLEPVPLPVRERWCRWEELWHSECVRRLSAAGARGPVAYESGGGQASAGALREQGREGRGRRPGRRGGGALREQGR